MLAAPGLALGWGWHLQCQKVDAWRELGVSLWFGGDGAALGPGDLMLEV